MPQKLFILGLLFCLVSPFASAQKSKKKKDQSAVEDTVKVKTAFLLSYDRDNDGIPDSLDECITEPGRKELKGCPDTDKDGIADIHDACPDVKGVITAKGCPDKDGDGYADDEDDCPDVFSSFAGGCPEKIEEPVYIQELSATRLILFGTADAEIGQKANAILDSIVQQLKNDPSLYIEIEGHTDNVGEPGRNLLLSQLRADHCRDYLLAHGIAVDRIWSCKGFGDTMPVGDNTKSEGKAQNRRAVFNFFIKRGG